MIIKIT